MDIFYHNIQNNQNDGVRGLVVKSLRGGCVFYLSLRGAKRRGNLITLIKEVL